MEWQGLKVSFNSSLALKSSINLGFDALKHRLEASLANARAILALLDAHQPRLVPRHLRGASYQRRADEAERRPQHAPVAEEIASGRYESLQLGGVVWRHQGIQSASGYPKVSITTPACADGVLVQPAST